MTFSLENIVSWAKRKWFVYPWSDIYWWLANAWDLWPYWTLLRKNILDNWKKNFIQQRENIFWIDSQILMNSKVWEASWHIGNFSDPLVDCKKCHSRQRADKLIEEKLEFLKKEKSDWDILLDIQKNIDSGIDSLVSESWTFEQQYSFLMNFDVKCSKCWSCDWTEPKSFNLMFKTQQWIVEWETRDIYLRPETAQWIFVNFKNIVDTMRVRIPFWLAQVWKAFRNEITPWNFLYRLREFEQMEIEFFIENDEKKWQEWLEFRKNESKNRWEEKIWIKSEKLRFRAHEKNELSFYSKWTRDVEYKFPRWWWELQWISYRTDYDLKQHQKFSWRDLQYSDPQTGKRFIPHVIEPSWWLTRAILAVMLDAYDEEKYTDQNWKDTNRVVLRFHKNIAPITFAILPLIKKDEKQVEIAKKLFKKLSFDYMCEYDIQWAIWKRYRRQDEIWTPYCLTVDQQSVQDFDEWKKFEDIEITIRDRDSMEQKRIKIWEINL